MLCFDCPIVKVCSNVRQKLKQSKSGGHDDEELMSYLEYINESRVSDNLIQEIRKLATNLTDEVLL